LLRNNGRAFRASTVSALICSGSALIEGIFCCGYRLVVLRTGNQRLQRFCDGSSIGKRLFVAGIDRIDVALTWVFGHPWNQTGSKHGRTHQDEQTESNGNITDLWYSHVILLLW